MRTPSPRLGWHPSLASLGEGYPPRAAARPGEPQEEGFDLVPETSPKKRGREAPRLNLGPAARLPVLRHHPGLWLARPLGRGGMLGTWKRWGARGARTERGTHPAHQGCLRRESTPEAENTSTAPWEEQPPESPESTFSVCPSLYDLCIHLFIHSSNKRDASIDEMQLLRKAWGWIKSVMQCASSTSTSLGIPETSELGAPAAPTMGMCTGARNRCTALLFLQTRKLTSRTLLPPRYAVSLGLGFPIYKMGITPFIRGTVSYFLKEYVCERRL
nr:uncharacterized protein LOC128780621 isoform X2 [Desmodus rotundus]